MNVNAHGLFLCDTPLVALDLHGWCQHRGGACTAILARVCPARIRVDTTIVPCKPVRTHTDWPINTVYTEAIICTCVRGAPIDVDLAVVPGEPSLARALVVIITTPSTVSTTVSLRARSSMSARIGLAGIPSCCTHTGLDINICYKSQGGSAQRRLCCALRGEERASGCRRDCSACE